ncbi:hypothetical protein G6O69_10925 [Pseudenhygromyxa sp. WMMC2535]|uniref:hypothetical protein n=1 Tax=Pseudenhygromyxa sp. WMMC2535 TaxID=2712867 RepID=UPI001557621D|nr:hypothetical protein [Pseudenhygromyxa sp. WMMC2535]NVB38343.1 hypothetical protein [Pseudenhygromyxa sp. WMMC2535]
MPASFETLLPRLRTLLVAAVAFLGSLALSAEAEAASPSGKSGPGGSYSTTGDSRMPDFVYGGNALSFMGPFQIGLTPKGFVPRGRFAFQYDRQLFRAHWLHVNAGIAFDRGDWQTFGMDSCGLESQSGTCEPGGVVGMDVSAGYTHKLFIEAKPWIVPTFRVGLTGGFWKLPRVGSSREQTRELSWTLGIQAAAGVRFFLLRELALGIDLELRPQLAVHRERADGAVDPDNQAAFVLPLQITPLILEYRF